MKSSTELSGHNEVTTAQPQLPSLLGIQLHMLGHWLLVMRLSPTQAYLLTALPAHRGDSLALQPPPMILALRLQKLLILWAGDR